MLLLRSCLGVAFTASLATALPFILPSLIVQELEIYKQGQASVAIAAKKGGATDPAINQGGPDGHLVPEGPDTDDDDDDEDLIPGDLLEGDSDSGGESDIGNDAVSVANGFLGSGGAGSAALNGHTSGSTAVFCSLFACASAAQSDGKVSTSATGATINATGPLISIKGPLVVIKASRTSVRKTSG
ncbi:hypothetical protein IF1G_01716 [Cordyceps javanica]|uniref:Uncharacterized protein n=1 Tax=Cordyceps javanica TaxID=43265 RepID=A0A545VCQ1_9HYPO|nr:hypothetical protein IF1G_01716 [Cordyceps javanica]TQW10822.1 hypothetical protein IF2G_01764 [Cordyceps javanica]